jgi:hypothetical protein
MKMAFTNIATEAIISPANAIAPRHCAATELFFDACHRTQAKIKQKSGGINAAHASTKGPEINMELSMTPSGIGTDDAFFYLGNCS